MPLRSRRLIAAFTALSLLLLLGTAARAARAYEFAPYVDMTLAQPPDLVAIGRASGVREASLGFVTARGGHACVPSWDGFRSSPAAGAGAYRLSNIDAFKAAGGSVVVSFGGAFGVELASACRSAGALQRAYSPVLAAYRPRRLDFDIEGRALSDRGAFARRSQAIAGLQRAHRGLVVSFTLPVDPGGLEPDAMAVLRSAIAHHVRVGLVNLMTMDFGDSLAPDPAGRMGSYAIQAARSVSRQLHRLYPRLSARRRMRMIGVTPMIGMNDTRDEVFTLSDAATVAGFARSAHLAMLAMWALNRDHRCPAAATRAQVTCSGVDQADWQFAETLGP